METTIIGIIDHTLYFAPFYAGDHCHEATINRHTKRDLLESGVKELPDYSHVQAYEHGMTHEEFLHRLAFTDRYHRFVKYIRSKQTPNVPDDLPF